MGQVAQVIADTPVGRIGADLATRDGAWRRVELGGAVRLGWSQADTLWFPA